MANTTDRAARQQLADSISSLWWMPLVRGVLLLLLGCYALFQPGMTAMSLAMVFGAFLMCDGILAVIAGVVGSVPSRLWTIVRGVAAILVGIFALAHPLAFAVGGTTAIMVTIALLAIALGALEIYAAIRDRKEMEGEGWLILGGVMAIIFGVLLLLYPLQAGPFLIRLLGVYAMLFGISSILFALRLRGFGKKIAERIS